LEREDIDNSLSDYMKALAMLEQLVEPDHRRTVELTSAYVWFMSWHPRLEMQSHIVQKRFHYASHAYID